MEPPMLWQDAKCVIRGQWTPSGKEFQVFIHKKNEQGREVTPRGYWLGSNAAAISFPEEPPCSNG